MRKSHHNHTHTCRIDLFERRRMLASGAIGVLVTHDLESETFDAGAQDVRMAELDVYAIPSSGRLQSLNFRAKPGTSFSGIQDFDLRADLLDANGRPGHDGVFETVLRRDVRPVRNAVTFTVNRSVDLRGLPLQVTADLKDVIGTQFIGLDQPKAAMTGGWWFNRPMPVYALGPQNPTHEVQESANLIVAERALPSTDTAVSNQSDCTFVRFEALAGQRDLLLTEVVLWNSGNTSPGELGENFTLWADTNGDGEVDTILEDGVSHSNEGVVFRDMAGGGFVVEAGQAVVLEAHGDVVSSLPQEPESKTLQLTVHSVAAEILANGTALGPSQIEVLNTPQTLWHFRESGVIEVSAGSMSIRSRQVLGGTLSAPLLTMDFRASYERMDVTYVGINVQGEGRSIDRIELFRAGETTPFAIATVFGAQPGDDFGAVMNSGNLLVPEDQMVNVIARARVKADTEGGMGGDAFSLSVDAVMARGDTSANAIEPEFLGDIRSPEHTVVMSRIAVIANANPAPNGTPVSLGTADIGQFRVAAANHGNFRNGLNDVVLDTLTFEVDAQNVELDSSGFRFFNKADATSQSAVFRLERMDGTPIADPVVTGQFRVIFTSLPNTVVQTAIDQGASETFVLQVRTMNAQVNPSVRSYLRAGLSLRPGDFWWIDQESAGMGLGGYVYDWIDYPESVIYSTMYMN